MCICTWFWWQTRCFFFTNEYCACRTNQIFTWTIQTGSTACWIHTIIGCADVIAVPTIRQYWRCTAQGRHKIRWKYTDFTSQFTAPPSFFDFTQKFNDVTNGQCELIIIILRVTVNCFESTIFRFRFIAVKYENKKKTNKSNCKFVWSHVIILCFMFCEQIHINKSINQSIDIKMTYRKTTGVLSSASKTRTKLSGNMPVWPVDANVPSHQPPDCIFMLLIMAPLINVNSSASFAL